MKKIFRVLMLTSLFMTAALLRTQGNAFAETISEIQEEAAAVSFAVSCDDVPEYRLGVITDGNAYTYYQFNADVKLTFKTSSPAKGLYFQFELPCRWTLSLPDGSVRQGGENEFVHEYFALDSETTEFTVSLPAGAMLTDVYAFAEGEAPSWVQVWKPPCQRADLMLMPTHADDEHLWFGGAMPYYAGELGYEVQVVYLTNHYNDTRRMHELLNGLWTVGVRNYPIITDRFLDVVPTKWSVENAEAYFGREKVLAFQVEMLRRFAPRVIIAHDINGEYGHGAHILNATTLLEALRIYEDPSVFPESAEKYGIQKVQKCYLHLWQENQITVQWSDKTLDRFGGKNAFEMAVEGYNCHRSQLRWKNYVLEWGNYDCRKFGLAYTTVGCDTPGLSDMFEHVDMSDKIAAQEQEAEPPAENPTAVSPSDRTVSASDENSDGDSYLHLHGIKILKTDAMIAALAAGLALIGIIAVICVKRRR